METQNIQATGYQENQIEINEKTTLKRSVSYPSLTIMDAYNFACKIYDKFSVSVEVNREEIAHALGLHSNTVSRDVAACGAFGFLSKTTSGKYRLSGLFEDIHKPESEKDKKLKLITAFGTPKLYQELITKFDNSVIPLEFPNTLSKHHGITEAASRFAADTFIQSGQEVGVINENRALKYQVTLSTASKTQYAEIVEDGEDGEDKNKQNGLPAKIDKPDFIENASFGESNKKVPIYLTKKKVAYLVYPDEISANDIKIIEHQLGGILLRIQFENEEKNKGNENPV